VFVWGRHTTQRPQLLSPTLASVMVGACSCTVSATILPIDIIDQCRIESIPLGSYRNRLITCKNFRAGLLAGDSFQSLSFAIGASLLSIGVRQERRLQTGAVGELAGASAARARFDSALMVDVTLPPVRVRAGEPCPARGGIAQGYLIDLIGQAVGSRSFLSHPRSRQGSA
jgi:hypothetical protein